MAASLWLAAGALLTLVSIGRCARAWAPWLASAPLLLATASWPAPIALTSIWLVLGVASLPGLWGVAPLPRAWQVVFCALTAAFPGLVPFVAHRWLAGGLPPVPATLVFPLAAVAGELLGSRVSPFGTWGSIAYTQFRWRALAQLTAVTGLWGITFLIGWSAPVLAQLWTERREGLTAAAAWAITLSVAVGWGQRRLRRAESGAATLRVATVTWSDAILARERFLGALSPGLAATEQQALARDFERVLDGFAVETRRAAAAGARLVVWPEACVPMFASDEVAQLARLADVARSCDVWLAAGIAVLDRADAARIRLDNAAVLYDPAGQLQWRYRKSRPVPGWEQRMSLPRPGQLPICSGELGRVSAAICFDLDFPALLRQCRRLDAQLLIAPASDWREIGELHHVQAMFRAIENGVPLVRSTRWGVAALCGATGRVVAARNSFQAEDRVLIGDLPRLTLATPYGRWGDAFVLAMLLAFVAVLAAITWR